MQKQRPRSATHRAARSVIAQLISAFDCYIDSTNPPKVAVQSCQCRNWSETRRQGFSRRGGNTFSLTPLDSYICGLRHLCQFHRTLTSSNESVTFCNHALGDYVKVDGKMVKNYSYKSFEFVYKGTFYLNS